MNERKTIARLKSSFPIPEGSTPLTITPLQQRSANLIGRLLVHAHKRGKRKNNQWIK